MRARFWVESYQASPNYAVIHSPEGESNSSKVSFRNLPTRITRASRQRTGLERFYFF